MIGVKTLRRRVSESADVSKDARRNASVQPSVIVLGVHVDGYVFKVLIADIPRLTEKEVGREQI